MMMMRKRAARPLITLDDRDALSCPLFRREGGEDGIALGTKSRAKPRTCLLVVPSGVTAVYSGVSRLAGLHDTGEYINVDATLFLAANTYIRIISYQTKLDCQTYIFQANTGTSRVHVLYTSEEVCSMSLGSRFCFHFCAGVGDILQLVGQSDEPSQTTGRFASQTIVVESRRLAW